MKSGKKDPRRQQVQRLAKIFQRYPGSNCGYHKDSSSYYQPRFPADCWEINLWCIFGDDWKAHYRMFFSNYLLFHGLDKEWPRYWSEEDTKKYQSLMYLEYKEIPRFATIIQAWEESNRGRRNRK